MNGSLYLGFVLKIEFSTWGPEPWYWESCTQIKIERRGIYMISQFISKLHREESGQDMLEYALVVAAVLAAVAAGTTSLSHTVSKELAEITKEIRNDVRKFF